MTNAEKAHRICETITSIYGVDIAQEAHVYSAVLEAMQWKDKQHAKEKQSEEIVTTIVNDWTYGKDADHAVIPAIHQRINGFKIGDKVLIQISKQ